MFPSLMKHLTAALMLLHCGLADASVRIDLTPTEQSADSLAVAVRISGLGDHSAPSVGSFNLDVLFDADVLSYATAEFGNQLDVRGFGGNPASAEVINEGVVNLDELSLDSIDDLNALQADAFTLAIVHFHRLTEGAATLELNLNALADAEGEALFAETRGTTVAPVPAPGALGLLSWGVAAVGLAARRRRRATAA